MDLLVLFLLALTFIYSVESHWRPRAPYNPSWPWPLIIVGRPIPEPVPVSLSLPEITPEEVAVFGNSDHSNETSQPITGGQEATPGAWPWQVRLGVRMGNGVNFVCGGSILSEIYVITAAHCFGSGTNLPYIIRVADHSAGRRDPDEADYRVLRLRLHENYRENQNFLNDIAILRVETPIKMSQRVSAVTLPKNGDDPRAGTSCAVTGFGMIGAGNAPYSTVLREAMVKVIDRNECRNRLWGNGVRTTNICAGYPEGRIDACKGDSGGPLVCRDQMSSNWVLQGLVSFGSTQGCGLPGKPAVYTRIGAYIPWIEATTGMKFD